MPRNGQPRIRSASSDSSCSSSSVSLSSQVSSPTSTCTELSTPTMPTFNGMHQPEVTFLNNMQAPHLFMAHEPKTDLGLADGPFCMPPPTSFVAPSYAPFDASFPQPASSVPSSEPLTYSSLAASSSAIQRNIGLKMVGMHSDPFLMSQPLPSPSLLLGSSSNPSMISNALLFTPHGALPPMPQDAQSLPSTSFENLLRIPSRPSPASNASDAASIDEPGLSSPSSSSSLATKTSSEINVKPLSFLSDGPGEIETSQPASANLDKAIANYVARSNAISTFPVPQSVAIASQPFSRVVELIGARFGLERNGEGLPQLLHRLQLSGKDSEEGESCKGLVFDATIDWDAMGSNMLPTTEQLLYPHRAFLDACLPWPAVRSRLLKHALTSPVCEQELALDLLLSVLSSDEALSSFRVYGDDILDPEAWELSERMLIKWWGLFDDSVIRRTNWWRRQRGLKDLCVPTPNEAANDSERQGLGTGSLDQVHRLASTLFP